VPFALKIKSSDPVSVVSITVPVILTLSNAHSSSVAVAIVLPSIANVITLSTPEFSKSAIMILDLVTSPSPI
jgi:hypothetical protein